MARRVVVKKKVTAARRKPEPAPKIPTLRQAGHRKVVTDDDEDEGFTMGGFLMIVTALVMIVGSVMLMIPKNLSHIQGYPYDKTKFSGAPKNLLRFVEDQIVTRDARVKITEAEINTYLNQRLASQQGGFLGGIVQVQAIYADIEQDQISFYLERRVFGIPFVIGTTWGVVLGDEGILTACKSSTAGLVTVPIILDPVIAPFKNMANAMQREWALIRDQDVRGFIVEKDEIRLEILSR